MPQKPTCYISYSWDSDILNFLLKLQQEIEKQSQNKVNVILDRRDFEIGTNFRKKEEQILNADLVIIFLTPEYKKKVDTPIENSGCFREFELIMKKQSDNERFIYPILFRGQKEHSVPCALCNIIYNLDVSSIKYNQVKSGHIIIEQHSRNKFNGLVSDIIKKTKINYLLNDIRYIDLTEKYRALLKNTAADNTLKKSCMIKMPAYKAILEQDSYFVIGRKGSGKTTLLETIEKLEPEIFMTRYKTLSPIKAEHIDMNIIYTIVNSLSRDREYIPVRDITDLYWEVFFIVQIMFVIGLEVENGKLNSSDYRYNSFSEAARFLRTKLGLKRGARLEEQSTKKQLSTLVIELIEKYFRENILDRADDVTFMASIKTNLNVQNIMEVFIGEKEFTAFASAFSRCDKKILLSLDGFDAHSEDFRRTTRSIKDTLPEEYSERNDFECLFYRSLVDVVMRFKTETYSTKIDKIIHNVDFCIVLPQDRLDQIKDIDRDISKKKCCGLVWDAFDLLKMLVLRLEENYNIESKDINLQERFRRVLEEKLPQIPYSIKVSAGDREYDFDLFNYMLRLSLWRPRDILLHFIGLLDLVENSDNVGIDIDDKMIKEALAQSARKIIDEEFIKEYQNVFYNLREVLNSFYGERNMFSISDFFERIGDVRFDASFSYDCVDIKNKILILYQLGIIGLYFDKNSINKRGYSYHMCFNFNEGLSPIYDTIMDRNTIANDAEIIINPLFYKAFNISIITPELIGNYDWEYIQRLTIEKLSKRRF